MIQVTQAGAADLDQLSEVIAEAFLDLPPSAWLIGDVQTRRQIFPSYFRLYLEHALANGIIHTTAEKTAVALWLPVTTSPAAGLPGYHTRLTAITWPWTERFLAFDAALDRHHPTGVPHHYLAILAVHPSQHGNGIGTALLGAHHRTLDQASAPAYLEASSPRNRDLYLPRGYTDLGAPIQLPNGIFAGTHDQVSAVRRFARAELGDHPALDEAVLVASELATNAITHSASGHDGGMFMVHLTAISADHVAILVTDQGGHGEPRAQHAGPDAESGRGLDIVTTIASLFIPFGDDTMRTIVAVVSPNGGSAERPGRLTLRLASQLTAVYLRSAARARSLSPGLGGSAQLFPMIRQLRRAASPSPARPAAQGARTARDQRGIR